MARWDYMEVQRAASEPRVASQSAKAPSFVLYAPFNASDVIRITPRGKNSEPEAIRCAPTMLDLDFAFFSS
jgi:hypothetical protein